MSVLTGAHFFAGIFAGVGYAALFGLGALRLSGRAAAAAQPVRWIGALGDRPPHSAARPAGAGVAASA